MAPLEPSAPQRRAWRLAYLLTGLNSEAASRLAMQTARPGGGGGGGADLARLDRQVVLAARLWSRSGKAIRGAAADQSHEPLRSGDSPAASLLRAVLALPRQALEVWVLTRLDELGELHVARAMDCSKTAAKAHLRRAEAVLSESKVQTPGALAELRAALDSVDPAPWITAAAERRRKVRRRKAAMGALAVVALGLAGAALAGQFL
ncbi:MAG: hypothetical protein H7Y88_13455 [Phycisphaerales bacterium]|nr:hypothetical protein [Phycisphaerales bacterium]